MPWIPASEKVYGMHVMKATSAYWDQAPIVFSLPGGFLTEPDRPLTADSQISSSILIQEARRRHQPRLDFPPTKLQRRNLLPQTPQSAGAGSVPAEPLSICHHRHSCQLAADEPTADASAKQPPIYFIFFPLSIHCGIQRSSVIHRKGHNSSVTWCFPFQWQRGVCDTRKGVFVLHVCGTLVGGGLTGWCYISRCKHF